MMMMLMTEQPNVTANNMTRSDNVTKSANESMTSSVHAETSASGTNKTTPTSSILTTVSPVATGSLHDDGKNPMTTPGSTSQIGLRNGNIFLLAERPVLKLFFVGLFWFVAP